VYVPNAKTISYDKAFEAASAVLKDAQYYNISKGP
jgi:hypothetical protein